MELTTIQKDLLNGLQSLKLNTETIVLVMTACQEEKQTQEMITWLIGQIDRKIIPTEERILNKIVEMNQEN